MCSAILDCWRSNKVILLEAETRVTDLANWTNEITGDKTRITYTGRRGWDKLTKRRALIWKARRMLSCEPKMTMKTGFGEVHRWLDENFDGIEASVFH